MIYSIRFSNYRFRSRFFMAEIYLNHSRNSYIIGAELEDTIIRILIAEIGLLKIPLAVRRSFI